MQTDRRILKEQVTNSSSHSICMKNTLSTNIQKKSKASKIQEKAIKKSNQS